MELDLTPKKYRPKPRSGKKRKPPRIMRNWNSPLQLFIIAVAVLAFFGSMAYDYIKSHNQYAAAVNEAHRLADEAAVLDEQATAAYKELQAVLQGVVLRRQSEQEVKLEERIDALNTALTDCLDQVNACYANLPFKYQSMSSERTWFIEFFGRHIRAALARKEYDLAVSWFNASHLKEYMPETRALAVGNGMLEITGGTNIDEVVVFPLKSDGPRMVPCDAIARSSTFPIELTEVEKGSYLVWATRADGTFSPYPVFIEHGEKERLDLEVPARIPEGTVFVPGGEFFCGGEESKVYRWHKVTLPAYFIGENEVTVDEYLAFWKSLDDPALKDAYMSRIDVDGGREPEAAWDASGNLVDSRLSLDFPVVGISLDAAKAYCAWLGGQLGQVVRLPTVFEWEKAARGVDGRTYPWGFGYDPNANFALSLNNAGARKTYPLWAPPGRFKNDVSIYTAYDMAGNVREMTTTPMPGKEGVFQVKGGSALTPVAYLQCAHVSEADGLLLDVGFRYVIEWKKEEP